MSSAEGEGGICGSTNWNITTRVIVHFVGCWAIRSWGLSGFPPLISLTCLFFLPHYQWPGSVVYPHSECASGVSWSKCLQLGTSFFCGFFSSHLSLSLQRVYNSSTINECKALWVAEDFGHVGLSSWYWPKLMQPLTDVLMCSECYDPFDSN